MWSTFDLVVLKGHFEVIRCTFLKWPVTQNWLVVQRNSEIWDSWILVTKIWGTFDLVGFKIILGSFSTLVSEWPVTQIWLVVD